MWVGVSQLGWGSSTGCPQCPVFVLMTLCLLIFSPFALNPFPDSQNLRGQYPGRVARTIRHLNRGLERANGQASSVYPWGLRVAHCTHLEWRELDRGGSCEVRERWG